MTKKLTLAALVLAGLMISAAPVTGNPTDTMVADVVDIDTHWAGNQMTHLVGLGVVKGYSTTVYDAEIGAWVPAKELRPDQKITRAEFAVMMYEALNLTPATEKAPFKDAAEIPVWAQKAVDTLYEKGIMVGSNGYVKPTAYITRAEIAAMVVQGLHDKREVAEAKNFPDLPSSHWAYKAVQKAADMGIILGKPDGRFAPGSHATRAEVMTMLFNMLTFDRTAVPEDSTVLEAADQFMQKNSEIISGGAPYDFSGLAPFVTGHEEAAISVNAELLNELSAEFDIQYEILSEGKVINKSDWLAEVVYDTKLTMKSEDLEEVMNMKEHVFLMKLNGKWLVYMVPSEAQ